MLKLIFQAKDTHLAKISQFAKQVQHFQNVPPKYFQVWPDSYLKQINHSFNYLIENGYLARVKEWWIWWQWKRCRRGQTKSADRTRSVRCHRARTQMDLSRHPPLARLLHYENTLVIICVKHRKLFKSLEWRMEYWNIKCNLMIVSVGPTLHCTSVSEEIDVTGSGSRLGAVLN